jgi:thiamine-phosphate pyrophosphorylase
VSPVVVFITDPHRDLVDPHARERVIRVASRVLGPGRLLVQLRDKARDEASLLVEARALREVTGDAGALFVVNGDARIAQASRADGVHVPGRPAVASVAAARALLGPDAIVTVAVHDDDDLRLAVEAGATAALVSPIFETLPRKNPPRGLEALVTARAFVDAARHSPALQIHALGGVTSARAAACVESGADGVAAIRALYDDGDAFVRAVARAHGGRT